ncbi:MAG: 1-deoxy-D-xylulose-5-phosphate reductoisomerase [Dysgonamonadaceae bacterium]|jgi:1-deoxy-D-xylulose-5-phosphate reductoisomerase|nr:1-deoxy-D-xylulose-5-phosphate reductoisomerase [Dysgonamonadaceae bacterium]
MKKIAILGSTGSIGTQALDVIRSNPELFKVYALTANRNAKLLVEQVREFNPKIAVIADKSKYGELKSALSGIPVEIWAGEDAIPEAASQAAVDIVLTAMVGYAGLKPTLSAIEAGKTIALANKETLVVAGEIVMEAAKKHGTAILPVDSEHSAIFQCLAGEKGNTVEKILLTASGGPFRKHSKEMLATVNKRDALNHPNWSMGEKITIDSATMMNKGFEMIEAKWLFGVTTAQIKILVHPQSIVHSMVQFVDNSVKAQMGLPDMRLPILYALAYPNRIPANFKSTDFTQLPPLTFEEPDMQRFPCLALTYEAIGQGGNMPCILNAANEAAVAAFLEDRISFTAIGTVIEKTMRRATFIPTPTLGDYILTDGEARTISEEIIRQVQALPGQQRPC